MAPGGKAGLERGEERELLAWHPQNKARKGAQFLLADRGERDTIFRKIQQRQVLKP